MNQLIGKKVVVFSAIGGVEKQDIGVLHSIEGIWLCIKKSEAESLFFCVYNIRMVKPFEV